MSRISCQQSAHWLASSLRATGLCRNSQKHLHITRNRNNNFKKSFFTSSTSQGSASKRSAKPATLDAATLDSISQVLIDDLSPAKAEVTIADVLALKPASSKITVDEFNKLKEVLAASFNVSQLKNVLRREARPTGGKKSVLINQIMLLMDLEVFIPEPKRPVVEDPYSAAEPKLLQQIFPSNKRELFFILGTEGDSMRQLEKEKGVIISINIADETYIIRGAKDSIVEAQARIREMVAVTEEVWDISSYDDRDLVLNRPSVMEDIARRSDTFVSAGRDETLNIAGRATKDIEEAKRLFDVKLYKRLNQHESMTFFHQMDELKPVGMFPVYDSANMSLDEIQKSYFRVCQTVPYADEVLDNTTIYPVLSSPSDIGTLEGLGAHLRSSMGGPYEPNQALELSAHFGQILFHNKNPAMTQLPFSTSFDTLELEEWLKRAENPYFFQSLPFFKAVSKLPLISPKTKTIEVEYIPTSRRLSSLSSLDPNTLAPIRIDFQFNHEGELYIHDAKSVNRHFFANLMMLDQPTDVQIRGELVTKIESESLALNDLLSRTTLPFANRLQCPSFYSFIDPLSSPVPAAANVGLGSTPTHTLRSIMFRTVGVFDFNGLPLVASDITDQYGHIRKQELKLLPIPLAAESMSTIKSELEAMPESNLESNSGSSSESRSESALPENEASSFAFPPSPPSPATSILSPTPVTSPLQHWDEFIKAMLHLNRTI
ncbi:hypothetical protein BGX27_003774 [Mortierella sp. AM989]|nr:hypothetical protein BGX27_003774 [Mortierella sp. AM989]